MKKTIILLITVLFAMFLFSMVSVYAQTCINPDPGYTCCDTGDGGPICHVSDNYGNKIGECYVPDCDGYGCCSQPEPFGQTKYGKDGDDCNVEECIGIWGDEQKCVECYNPVGPSIAKVSDDCETSDRTECQSYTCYNPATEIVCGSRCNSQRCDITDTCYNQNEAMWDSSESCCEKNADGLNGIADTNGNGIPETCCTGTTPYVVSVGIETSSIFPGGLSTCEPDEGSVSHKQKCVECRNSLDCDSLSDEMCCNGECKGRSGNVCCGPGDSSPSVDCREPFARDADHCVGEGQCYAADSGSNTHCLDVGSVTSGYDTLHSDSYMVVAGNWRKEMVDSANAACAGAVGTAKWKSFCASDDVTQTKSPDTCLYNMVMEIGSPGVPGVTGSFTGNFGEMDFTLGGGSYYTRETRHNPEVSWVKTTLDGGSRLGGGRGGSSRPIWTKVITDTPTTSIDQHWYIRIGSNIQLGESDWVLNPYLTVDDLQQLGGGATVFNPAPIKLGNANIGIICDVGVSGSGDSHVTAGVGIKFGP